MSDTRRMVSCMSGDINHLFYVVPGSAADAACPGQHISREQCPICIEERRTQLHREAELCECNFNPGAELCQEGCAYLKDGRDLADAPDGLVGYITEQILAPINWPLVHSIMDGDCGPQALD